MFNKIRISHPLPFVLLGIISISVLTIAQTTPPANPTGPVMRFTATTASVSGAPDSVRFDVLAWSTDADRDQMVGAWNLTAVPAAAGARGERGERGGAGGARGGRGAGGGAGAAPDAPDAAAGANPAEAAPAAGAGRGGRGGGRGAAAAGAADTAPKTPESALATALQAARTVGYLWSSESAGYSLRYAYRMLQPDGVEQ